MKVDVKRLPLPELLRYCTNGDEVGWCEFVRRFQPWIVSVVLKTLRRCASSRCALVYDLVQETYLKLCASNFKALRNFESQHDRAFMGFLKAVASNVTQDYLRSSLCQKRGNGKVEDDLSCVVPDRSFSFNDNEVTEQRVVWRQIRRHLESGYLESALQRDYTILLLRYRYGLTAQEIAQRDDLSLSAKGVESVLFRLTQFLRKEMTHQRQGEHDGAQDLSHV